VGRRRHPKKDVEKALQYAESNGWEVIEVHRSHRWGYTVCGFGCALSIPSTPRNPTMIAKRLQQTVDRCTHD
jgi:hypothetical protein